MRELKCTNCGNTESIRWKLIKDEILCDKCYKPEARANWSAQTKVEFNTSTMEESMNSFADNTEI